MKAAGRGTTMAAVKAVLRKVHRYAGLAFAALWLSQALTGILMVFRWELDDATVAGPMAPLDVDALGVRIAALAAERPDLEVYQVYASGGTTGRFDIYRRDPDGNAEIIRVAGDGSVLRSQPFGRGYANAGLIQAAAFLHQTLFAGETGKVFVGLSGLLLLSSIVMGLVIAWPRAGEWRRALVPRTAGAGAAGLHAWHRAAGLWFAGPAAILIAMGALMTIEDSLEGWLGQDFAPPELQAAPALTGNPIGLPLAIRAAQRRFPSAELSGVAMPTHERPWYRVRVRQAGEWRRVYGTTVVYVSAADGRVILQQDALAAPAARAFIDNLYPIHTGEIGGLPGRLVSLAVGVWLVAMLGLGLGLWWVRRRRPVPRS